MNGMNCIGEMWKMERERESKKERARRSGGGKINLAWQRLDCTRARTDVSGIYVYAWSSRQSRIGARRRHGYDPCVLQMKINEALILLPPSIGTLPLQCQNSSLFLCRFTTQQMYCYLLLRYNIVLYFFHAYGGTSQAYPIQPSLRDVRLNTRYESIV